MTLVEAPLPTPLTREWLLENCSTKFQAHMNCSEVSSSAGFICITSTGARTGLSYANRTYEDVKRNGKLAGRSVRVFFVDEIEGEEFDTLDKLVDAFNAHRENLRRDDEWEAAAPLGTVPPHP